MEIALRKATIRRDVEVVEALVERMHLDLDAPDREGWTALLEASMAGDTVIIKALLEGGAHVNVSDHNLWTTLHHAVFWGHSEVLAILHEAGANLNKRTKDGMTPLHYAAQWDDIDCVKVLVDAGASCNIIDENGLTASDLANILGNTEVEAYISQHGKDYPKRPFNRVAIKDKSGRKTSNPDVTKREKKASTAL